MASARDNKIWDPNSRIWGIDSLILSTNCPMPSEIMPMPLSESPLKISVSPSMTEVTAGRNSVIIPRLAPSRAVCISWRLSWYLAAALTASLDITPPSSLTRFFISAVSFAEVFSRGPSSFAEPPRSSAARAVRSEPSSISWRPAMTAENRSSWLMEATSSTLKPSFSKASLPDCAFFARVMMPRPMASMEEPEC